jgi:hypothetical protein
MTQFSGMEYNCETGEATPILDDSDYKQYLATATAEQEAADKKVQDRLGILAKLGLSEDEAKILLG